MFKIPKIKIPKVKMPDVVGNVKDLGKKVGSGIKAVSYTHLTLPTKA